MAEFPVQFTFTLNDQVSSAANGVKSAVAGLGEGFDQVDAKVKTATQSFSSQVLQVNSLALAGATLFMSFERVENSEVALDRANLNVQKSTNSLQSATEAYNKALASGDPQKITDALAKLNTAQDALTVSQERADMAQRNLNSSMIYAALSVVPSAIAVIGGLGSVYQKLPETIANVTSKLASLDISMKTLAISTVAAVGAFAATYAILETIPEPMRETAAVIAIITGVAIAATVAIAAFYGALSWGMAVPGILIGVGAAVAGVTVALQGASSAVDAYSGSLTSVTDATATFVAVENTLYQTDLANLTASWNTKLGLTKTALETIEGLITAYYTDEETLAQTAYQKDVDVANAAYVQQLTDFKSYWSQRLGIQTAELTTVDSEIESHYNQQISDTNAFYNDLITASMTGLNNLRAQRDRENDNLELNYLLQKTALEDAHNHGEISDKDYQTQLNDLNQKYNTSRSEMNDNYRLQELQAEKEQTAAAVPIEQDQANAIAKIEYQKNDDLLAAQATYASITTTGQQALNTTLTTLANELEATLLAIKIQGNADLALADAESLVIEQAYQARLIQDAVATAAKLATITPTYSVTVPTILPTQYGGGTAPTLPGGSAPGAQTTVVATVLSAILASYSTYSSPTALAAAIVALTRSNNGLYNDALNVIAGLGANKGWTAQNISSLKAMIPTFAVGGIAYEPTLALLGESGPEAVIPLGRGRDYGSVINNYDFSGFSVTIEGNVDQKTLAVLQKMLKTVVVEATSQGAPATQKRIIQGSVF